MRKIGHEILLYAGDSTSKVLPVKRIKKDAFQLQFQSKFSFDPDTLVRVIHQSLASGNLPLHYLVNVVDCATRDIVYGYEIFGNRQNDLIPCLGREQTVGCYTIHITFVRNPLLALFSDNTFTVAGCIMAGLLIFIGIAVAQRKKTSHPSEGEHTEVFIIGKYTFKAKQQLLLWKHGHKNIALTSKEANLLKVFACHPNQLLSRDWLLKEIWENEGVFVGRSLDVFVSKLRQKLQDDPHVKIVNVHGKGYKLAINSHATTPYPMAASGRSFSS
jgi:DNA-binding winged helix-turn-helix (wHTH) protein